MLLARRATALKRHLREAVAGNGVGVHRARVASRRLREAVPVLATGLKKSKAGKARKKIRRVTRALGAIRELDVSMALLDELAAREGVPRLALEDVRAFVLKEQERRRGVMLKRLGKVDTQKLGRRLGSLGEALQQSAVDEWRETLASRLLKRAKTLKTALGKAGHLYEAERLHKVRIAAKKLRYAAEMAAETGVKTAAAPVRTLKRTQDTLGRLHDLQMLQGYIAAVQAQPRRSPSNDAGLDAIAQLLEDECRHLHAAFVATVPALTAVIDDVRAVVVPQLARRGRRRRPLKMKIAPGRPRRAAGAAAAR